MRSFLILSALVAGFACMRADAAELFAGKTISIVVGSPAGGGYDLYARLLSRHLASYLPGKPTVIVQNMPGAGSAKAAGYIASIAPKDGTAIGAISSGILMSPLLDPSTQWQYDPTKLAYLGTANRNTRVCITMAASPVKTFPDAQKIPIILGTGAEGDSTRDDGHFLKNVGGAKFNLVTGYTGTPDIFLAMQRGEVDGVCGWDWASLRSQRAADIRDKAINVFVQAGPEPNDELTRMGVPELWPYISDDLNRQVARLYTSQQLFGRPFIAPPGTSEAALGILRTAFMAALADPELLADAKQSNLEVKPLDGQRVQTEIERIYSAPKAVVERARSALYQ
jgi:tripartite-type tricarboxylate transporter receptor subunit TctC